VFKDLAHLGISKHGARFAPASLLSQDAPPTRAAKGRCLCCVLSCP